MKLRRRIRLTARSQRIEYDAAGKPAVTMWDHHRTGRVECPERLWSAATRKAYEAAVAQHVARMLNPKKDPWYLDEVKFIRYGVRGA